MRSPEESDHQANNDDLETIPVASSDMAAQKKYGEIAQCIGNYRLIEQLGSGGMGEVWLAEQSQPVKRKVAVKLIKPGMGSQEVIARFEGERQALALMNHPNIARILDAGTTDSGQPYFVMELVSGESLTSFCDNNRYSIDERLRLFIAVCSGVQHAHQKGIIHRDLKPSNILVMMQDGAPIPKIIDFGLAKAMESSQRLTDQSLFTGIGQILGTLKYMSPEQASLGTIDIDTRTDIYSLGIILYELLTGSTPLDDASIKQMAIQKVLDIVRDIEPVRPSSRIGSSSEARISTISGHRNTNSVRLSRLLERDLDWIVMKALEKERGRRYDSASGFAADLQRYLNNEPVIARPPSLNYRLQKFVRKNRMAVIAGSLVTCSLMAGIAGTSLGLLRAKNQAALARREANEKEAARVEAQNQAQNARNQTLIAERETREKESALAKEQEQRAVAEQARIEAEKQREEAQKNLAFARKGNEILATVFADLDPHAEYSTVAEFRNAMFDNLIQAIQLLEEHSIGDALEVAEMKTVVANSLSGLGEFERAIAIHHEVLQLREHELGKTHLDTLKSINLLSVAYKSSGQLVKATEFAKEAFLLRSERIGPFHEDSLTSAKNLAVMYLESGQPRKAMELFSDMHLFLDSQRGAGHPQTLMIVTELANTYSALGQFELAVELYEKSIGLMKTEFSSISENQLVAMSRLARAYSDAGHLDKSLSMYQETLTQYRERVGADHRETLAFMIELGQFFNGIGQSHDAIRILQQVVDIRTEKFGPEHPLTLNSMNHLASAHYNSGDIANATSVAEKTLRLSKEKLGTDHSYTLETMATLALCYEAVGDLDAAIPIYEQVFDFQKAKRGSRHRYTLVAANNLAVAYADQRRTGAAISLTQETLAARKETLGEYHRETLTSANNLASMHLDNGQFDEALSLLEEVYLLQRDQIGADHPGTLTTLINLAYGKNRRGETSLATKYAEEAYELTNRRLGIEHPLTLTVHNNLAHIYQKQGRLADALTLFEQAARQIELAGFRSSNAFKIVSGTWDAYEEAGMFERADEWRLKWIQFQKEASGHDSFDYLIELREYADSLSERHRWADAEGLLRECVDIQDRIQDGIWQAFHVRTRLGGVLLAQGKLDEAEQFLVEGYNGMKAIEESIPEEVRSMRLNEALDRLISLYTFLERLDEAEKWKKQKND